MRTRILAVACMAMVAAGLLSCSSSGERPSKERIAALVDKAAALVECDGEKAFVKFREKGSEWYRGDVYIFVDDMDGKNLCHPVQPDLEGKSLLDLKDAQGKAFVREMIELLKTKDAGWVEYAWPKPGQTAASKKLAYIRKAKLDDKMVLVGSGLYAE